MRRLSAECFGTFALVFVAAGADTLATLSSGEVSSAARAVAPALMIAALIYAIGDVSGAHFNPAVTLAFAARGLFPARLVGPYWAAQLVGAVAGALLLRGMFGAASVAGISTPHIAAATAVGLEAMFTLLLVTVVLGTADRARIVGPDAALAVGATIALCGLIGLPVEGASMNPARSLGPAIVGGDLSNAWIYVVGPIAGGLLAVALARLLHGPPATEGEAAEAAQGG
ncbi:MAG TPA: aquaporin [Candidatus Limnocylindrales bacterium]